MTWGREVDILRLVDDQSGHVGACVQFLGLARATSGY